ncbi:MAG TPA: NrfD/PsrC family molybdoenzyme membrane anchor subunit, partial [Candidatus Limnocylindria bacterium]|nr:NrfD/PsrC family molybdoenzyme membrane anchor subunit [Candidatus Limnocylindria bacterium]
MDDRTQQLYRERAIANVGRTGPVWWAIAIALAGIVAAGVYAYTVQVRYGHAVTGTNRTIFWGLYIANFVFFIGISYGGAITSAILRLTGAKWRAPITRIAEAMAVVTLAVGALSVLIDVARPDRMLNLFIYAQPGSPITWDWIAINTYLVGTVIFFYLPLIPDLGKLRDTLPANSLRRRLYAAVALRWEGTPAQERWLIRAVGIMAVVIIPLAVSVHSVLAWLFAMTVREGWHSTIFGPQFVVAAMLSGVGMVILVIAAARKVYHL